jgi:hypothetical protein
MQTEFDGDFMPKKRGRPTLAEEAKSSTIGARVSNRTRAWLEQGAAEGGHSLSQEIVLRLDQVRRAEEAAGGREPHRLHLLIQLAIDTIEKNTGKSFAHDWPTFAMVMSAINSILRTFRPAMAGNLKSWLTDLGEDPGPQPELPERPRPPSGKNALAMLAWKPTPEEEAKYEKAMEDYRDRSVDWNARVRAQIQRGQERLDYIKDLEAAGQEVAVLLFPKPKQEG